MSYPTFETGKNLKVQMTAHRADILSEHRPVMIGEPRTGQVLHLSHNLRCCIVHLHLESPAIANTKPVSSRKSAKAFVIQLVFSPCLLLRLHHHLTRAQLHIIHD